MTIDFRINLVQFYPKPTTQPPPPPPSPVPMVGTEVSENLLPQKGIYGEKRSCKFIYYALRVVTLGTVFSSNMNLSKNKNKNIEDEKIEHIWVKYLVL